MKKARLKIRYKKMVGIGLVMFVLIGLSNLYCAAGSVKAEDVIYYYVDCNNGNDNNDGSEFNPYKTISKAVYEVKCQAKTAEKPIEIHVKPWEYRERVALYISDRAVDDSGKPYQISFIADSDTGPVVIKGSEKIESGWELYNPPSNVWKVSLGSLLDEIKQYYETQANKIKDKGHYYELGPYARGFIRRQEQVYQDGLPLRQVNYFCHFDDLETNVLWLKLDELSGYTVFDSSGKENHGTIKGKDGPARDYLKELFYDLLGSGKSRFLTLDGRDDYVDLQDKLTLFLT